MSLLVNPTEQWRAFEATNSLVKPAINIMENRHTYKIELVAPGLKVNDFKIQVQKQHLWISGAHHENNGQPANTLHQEFYHDHIQFSRCLELPDNIVPHDYTTYYHQGILTICFAKKP